MPNQNCLRERLLRNMSMGIFVPLGKSEVRAAGSEIIGRMGERSKSIEKCSFGHLSYSCRSIHLHEMKSPTFEIKVAFCGNVNAGKSTLVNALLQQKYSEVSMDRTTLGVNSFRIFSNKDKVVNDADDFDSVSSSGTKERDEEVGTTWSVLPEKLHTAKETYQTIADVNSTLRGTSKIEESIFDIEVPEPICDMREDTQLVIVDLPGFPVEECNLVYKYLSSNWDSFDCVVVVLDIAESINNQLELIRFVVDLLKGSKEIPVIFACNKVDSPYDPELNSKLEELEYAANCIFVHNGTFSSYL
jgi:GTP-binding protein EngB required for normal cell division